MKIIRYAFFLGVLVLTGQSGWAQTVQTGFTVSGRRCIPEGDCGGDSTVFRADTSIRGARSWLWTFGDTTPGVVNTGSGRVVRHLYAQPGTYTVTLTVGRYNSTDSTLTFTQQVTVNALPPSFEFFGGKEDTLLCPKDSILLDPYQGQRPPPGVVYSWYPTGATTQTIWASEAKCYSVEVKDTLTGCSVTDRINVKICGQNDQQQAAKWYFGANAGVSFEGGQPTAITDGKVNTPEGVSAISNKQGQLLFYTDGILVFDKEGNPIRWRNPADSVRAGGKLAGSQSSTQSALIVPQPECRGCETIYYIFTTNDSTKQLSYTIVDMRGNRGKGEIVEANVPLHGGSTERISSVQNPVDSTYWVVTRDTSSNKYRFYKVTKTGVIETSTRELGTPNLTNPQSEGYLKFSNNGKKLAIVIPGPPRNFVEVYDFNDSTGATGPPVTIDLGPSPPRAYGVEFSPDGTNMFVSFTGDSAGTVASKILAYNVERMDSTAIALTRITVDSTKGVRYGALQYAPDGKIYLAIEGSTSLGVINNPDTTTAQAMDFVRNGLSLDGRRSLLGLPNFVQSIIQPPSGPGISYLDSCGAPTRFQSGPICEPREDTYEWDFGDGGTGSGQQVTHLYARPGTYTVKLRQFNDCKDTTMTAQVVIRTSPKVNLGQDINQCRPSVTLDVGPGAVDTSFVYIWYRNGRVLGNARYSPRITVDSSGQYVVQVSSGDRNNPCIDLDTIQVNLIQPRPINLGSDTTLCPGQRVTLEPRGLQVSSATYQWTLGGNPVGSSSTLGVNRAGTYILTITDNSRGNIECVNSDTLVVGAGQKPRIQATLRDATGCQTLDGRIEVIPQGQGGSAGVNFTWSRDGAQLPPIAQSTPILDNVGIGTYRLTLFYSNQNGPTTCTLDTTFTLNARNPDVQVERDRLTNATCTQPNGGEITLRTVRGAPVTYVWRNSAGAQIPNQTGPTLTGVPAGTYSVEVRDANDCRFTLGNLILRQDPTRLVTLRDTAACAGQTLQLDAGALGDTYRWSTGATTRTITVTQGGAYNVLVTDSRTGCSSRDTALLRFNPKPNIVVGPTQSVCANVAPLQLAATPAGGTWSGTGVTPQGLFRPAQVLNGNVTLTYSVAQQGCADSARKVLNVLPIPTVDLGPDRSFCANEAQTLSVPEVPPATYRWSTGETTSSIKPTRTGTYAVSVALGTCRAADTVRVTVLPAPVFSLKGEVPLCAVDRDTVTLDAGGLPGYTYRWNPGGETTRRIRIDRLGTFRVRVSTPEGCTEERPVEVFDECDPRIVVPDIFTPNGDGVNDRLDVFTAHISEYQLTIFNRWGEMVFRTNDPNEKWDGSYKGAQYPTQSYAWVIAYKAAYFPERGTEYKRGAVLVAR